MNKRTEFLKAAIFDKQVGAVMKSSKYVVETALKSVDVRRLHYVVEYGPGDGAMTRKLLQSLPSESKILVIESNANFVKILNKIRDPRLEIIHGNIQETIPLLKKYGFGRVDAVFSSTPLSLLPPNERDVILKNTLLLLNAGGAFIIFHQYSLLMIGQLKKYFDVVSIRFELRNILPCFIIYAKKRYDTPVARPSSAKAEHG